MASLTTLKQKLKQKLCSSSSCLRCLSSRATLTPTQIKRILREHDMSVVGSGVVGGIESNFLAANKPVEDRRSLAKLKYNDTYIFGVFDGHGGWGCAQSVSDRLFAYIASGMLPYEHLKHFRESISQQNVGQYLEYFRHRGDYTTWNTTYTQNLLKYLQEVMAAYDDEIHMPYVFENAFSRLDQDIATEAMADNGHTDIEAVHTAYSGACACVAVVSGKDLYVAHCGDSRAVLASRSSDDTWTVKKLTKDHNIYNQEEVKRIISEHPPNEQTTVLRGGRLLSELAPLRAFGDMKYKWKQQTQQKVQSSVFGRNLIPPHFYTPPYLSVLPDVTHHRLTSDDYFLILATDGLWDMLSSRDTIKVVGDHMMGRSLLEPLSVKGTMTLREIETAVSSRKAMVEMAGVDKNACTHLIRHAIGYGDNGGFDNEKLSNMLTMPDDLVRWNRDDITIVVVYFNHSS